MSNFDDIWADLKKEVSTYAVESFKDFKDAAISDGEAFLENSKADIEQWMLELAAGQLSEADFLWLIKAKKDLAELTALKQKGLAKAAMDKFVDGVINIVISKAVSLI